MSIQTKVDGDKSWLFQDTPMICGGSNGGDSLNTCYSLEGSEWLPSGNMNSARKWAAVSFSPSNPEELIVTGGFQLSSAEVWIGNGWQILPIAVPVAIYRYSDIILKYSRCRLMGSLLDREKLIPITELILISKGVKHTIGLKWYLGFAK